LLFQVLTAVSLSRKPSSIYWTDLPSWKIHTVSVSSRLAVC
jgi:hypothetical protein